MVKKAAAWLGWDYSTRRPRRRSSRLRLSRLTNDRPLQVPGSEPPQLRLT